jgi:hypothetical protein
MNIVVTPELVGIIITALISVLTFAYTFGGLKSQVSDMRDLKSTVQGLVESIGFIRGELGGIQSDVSFLMGQKSAVGNLPRKFTEEELHQGDES